MTAHVIWLDAPSRTTSARRWDAGGSLEEIIVAWQNELVRFGAIRSRYLIDRGR